MTKKALFPRKISKSFLVCLALISLLALSQSGLRQICTIYKFSSSQVVAFKRDWAREDNFLKDSNGADSVFFMGNSKITAGIIPKLFDEYLDNEVYSYNLALPALPLAPHYFMLKEYLERNPPPKYIIMTLHPEGFTHELFPTYSILGARADEVLLYAYLSGNTEIIWNHFYPLGSYWKDIKKYLEGRLLSVMPEWVRKAHRDDFFQRFSSKETYQHDWQLFYESEYLAPEKHAIELREGLRNNRGYYYIEGQAVIGGRLPDDYVPEWARAEVDQKQSLKHAKVSSDHQLQKRVWKSTSFEQFSQVEIDAPEPDPFLDRFFEINRKNGTKVILIYDYLIDFRGREIEPRRLVPPQRWIRLKKKFDNVYFVENGFEPKFYEPRYFADPVHLNPGGASIYTQEIAREFAAIMRDVIQKSVTEKPQTPKPMFDTALKQFSQMIAAKSKPESLKVNEKVTFPVTVQNTGEETWPSSGGKPVHLAYRWLDSTGKSIKEGNRTVLPRNLKPGESVMLNATVTALDRPGKYTLRLDMVQETVAWFSGAGGVRPLEFPVVIK